jgi:hypothetical protein
MTVALCIKCGAMKRGALTHCFECDFHPQEHEDMGKAMVLTNSPFFVTSSHHSIVAETSLE